MTYNGPRKKVIADHVKDSYYPLNNCSCEGAA